MNELMLPGIHCVGKVSQTIGYLIFIHLFHSFVHVLIHLYVSFISHEQADGVTCFGTDVRILRTFDCASLLRMSADWIMTTSAMFF